MKAVSITTRYRVIVPDVSETCFLALPARDGWSLPGWSIDGAPAWEDASTVNAGIKESLGLRVTMLRATARDWTETRRDSYYLVENLDPAWQPEHGARWIPKDEAETLRWANSREAAQIQEWVAGQASPTRVPWYSPGWFDTVERWIASALRQAGIASDRGVEQLRSWERCSLFRVTTRDGDVYFKAVPPQWGHEPALTDYLSTRFPGRVPAPIAVDPGRGYLLMRDFGGGPVTGITDLAIWSEAYAELARMQKALVSDVEGLRRLGVPYQPPAEIQPRIGAMIRDERRMRFGMGRGLSREGIDSLQQAEVLFAAACKRLAHGPIPLSLDHGDFWPGNIQSTPDGPILFDWSDATITHPFFSLVMAADEIDACFPEITGAGDTVVEAYLDEWTEYASPAELRAIFDDAMLIAPLYLSLMYRDHYLPAMEFPDELDRMTPHFLRWLVGRL